MPVCLSAQDLGKLKTHVHFGNGGGRADERNIALQVGAAVLSPQSTATLIYLPRQAACKWCPRTHVHHLVVPPMPLKERGLLRLDKRVVTMSCTAILIGSCY